MRKNIPQATTARGFSLVELMVALLIGLIISIGVVQIFGATRATYQLDESLARAQENGRFALEFLHQDIRHAGYAGCLRDTTFARLGAPGRATIFNSLATPTDPTLTLIGISGAEYTGTGYSGAYSLLPFPTNITTGWAPTLTGVTGPLGTPNGALPGSDVLVLQHMVPNSWALVAPYVNADNVFIDPTLVSKLTPGLNRDVLLVADCRSAVAFMPTAVTAAGVVSHAVSPTTNRCARWTNDLDTANADAACQGAFDYDDVPSTTAIGRLETVVFFVANDNSSGALRPTLFRRVRLATGVDDDPVALVEGVESFQVLYGVDDVPEFDGAADSYVPANAVADFSRVVSVQIGLLVYGVNATGSANDTAFDTDTHDVAGTLIAPAVNSTRKRRVFNTTIQLRNRSF